MNSQLQSEGTQARSGQLLSVRMTYSLKVTEAVDLGVTLGEGLATVLGGAEAEGLGHTALVLGRGGRVGASDEGDDREDGDELV